MRSSPTFSIFTELTLHEQANLSGGSSIVCSSGNGGNANANGGNANANGVAGSNGGIAIAGAGGYSQPGRSCKAGKLSKADKKVIRQVFVQVSSLLSGLFKL